MSTHNIASTTSLSATDGSTSPARAQDRARLAELAAEFESMLLVNVLRDMRSSGRWSTSDSGDVLGAETFNQTMDVELSRYLARSGGFGLSQRLLGAFDAITRMAEAAPAMSSGDAPAGALAPMTRSTAPAYGGRTGWMGLRLEPPPSGGSGAEWAGFNADRAMAGGDEKSVKDAFYRWTYGLSYNPAGKSKEEIASFLRDNIGSAREYGLNVLDVRGEQILVETAERGAEWVDVVASAGSTQAKWQWLTQAEFGEEIGGGALGTALAALRNMPDGEARARQLLTSSRELGDALLTKVQAETSAAARGERVLVGNLPSTPDQLRSVANTVTSPFGWRQDPFTGATRFHQGIDVQASEGDPVNSTGAGRVIFSGTDGAYGTTVVVEHANGLTTRYAHLSSALVGVGEQVEDGQILGLVGRTGRATGPHLHYEVRVAGRAVDPLHE